MNAMKCPLSSPRHGGCQAAWAGGDPGKTRRGLHVFKNPMGGIGRRLDETAVSSAPVPDEGLEAKVETGLDDVTVDIGLVGS